MEDQELMHVNDSGKLWRYKPSQVQEVRMFNYMKMAGIRKKGDFLSQCVNWFLQDNEKRMAERILKKG